MWFLGADRLRRIWEKQKIKGISRALILRLHYFKASLIILEGTIFKYLAFVWQETSKYTVFQLYWLTQLSCSSLPQWRERFKFVWGYVYTLAWLKLGHEPTLDILARTLHLHSSQTVLIGVATEWQTVWAGNCKQHFKVSMKNSLNLSSAELDCGSASGLLQGKGTSITQQGLFKRTLLVCTEAVKLWGQAQAGVVPKAGRNGDSIPTTATRSVGELGADSVTAATLHQSCRRSLKITWTSSACKSWVSLQVLVADSGSCLLPGSREWNLSQRAVFAGPWASRKRALSTSTSLTQEVGWLSLPPSCGAGVFLYMGMLGQSK